MDRERQAEERGKEKRERVIKKGWSDCEEEEEEEEGKKL